MKNIWYILISTFILTYSSCDPFPTCTENDSLPNFESLTNIEGLAFPSVVITGAALDTFYLGQELVIDSTEYQAMEQRQLNDSTCTDCNFPAIDFNANLLIGQVVQLDCLERIDAKVIKTGSVYEVYLKIINESQCTTSSCPSPVIVLMTIPKLESGETITFNGGRFFYTCEDC